MAVNTSTNKISYTGDGTTTIFAYNFKILDAAHLNVYLAGVLLTSGYSVTGVGADAGGGVVFSTAPGSGVAVFLQRIVPVTQPVSTVDNSTILSSVLDTALDRVTMQVQQNSATIAGAVVNPSTDPALDMTLPAQAERSNKYFYFDANGEPAVISSQIVGYYYGSLAADPSTRPDGSARVAGDIYFSTSTLGIRVYTGTAWTAALPTASLTLGNFTEVAASAKTTFTITGGYSVGSTFVYLNGTLLYPTEYTATNGTTIVLDTACAINDEFRAISYSNFSVADTLSKASNLSDIPSATTALTNLGFSTFAQSLRDDADAATFRTSLGLAFGATAAKSTTVQAQAGTDDASVMTPLTTAQALTALGSSTTLLGRVSTVGGVSATISGLNLSNYNFLVVAIESVSSSSAVPFLSLGGLAISAGLSSSSDTWVGMHTISLFNGLLSGVTKTSTANAPYAGYTSYTAASTSVTLSQSGGPGSFDAGAFAVYGVR